MDEHDTLARQFEAERGRLRAVAYRMLGSLGEAEDAVQEAWIRLDRSGGESVANLRGWLTTVVARVCLDMLRARKARREEPIGPTTPEPADPADPAREAELADSVGLALLVVLDSLAPAERIAFVLHDMFDLPFEEIARVVGRSPVAARQLASRARRRVRGQAGDEDALRHRRAVVDAFLVAAKNNDLAGLLAVLAPDVELRADAAAVALGGHPETRGADAVAAQFAGRAAAARAGLVDGALAIVVAPRGRLLLVLIPTIANGRIAALEAIADRERLCGFEIPMLDP
ncbi:MAG TPA: sigma-70 family RNA polymerase sigma factor [Hyphomicrobiales bacterium]|nr:sigma-70 family RNA polymerase sigma factor [Hyphomicrobiales bacterium]